MKKKLLYDNPGGAMCNVDINVIKEVTLVSFYTETYEKYVENFVSNAERLSCKTYIEKKTEWKPKHNEQIKNQRHSNCKWKPSVVKSALSRNEICLWLDIDCRIEKINYVPEKFDIGYFTNVPQKYTNKISVGWIWFNNTPNTFKFLEQWEKNLIQSPQDHNAFTTTYKSRTNPISLLDVTDSIQVIHNY